MYLNDLYTMYKLTYHLLTNENYDILYTDKNDDEIWLEKYNKKHSKIIRITHKGFHWQNHLRKDIAVLFQKVKAMKKLIKGKYIEVFNIYVSDYAPVDDWEALKKPMQLKEKNPIKMKLFYLYNEEFNEEFERLQTSLHLSNIDMNDDLLDSEKEIEIKSYKRYFFQLVENKRKETKEVFSFGKPFLTYFIIIINIIMFYLLEQNGDSTATNTLIEFGAKYNPAIIEANEWWRIISSMFIHIGFLHLFMNMIAVYFLGTLVERIYGSFRFLVVYFLSGVGGGLASFAFSMNISAGASGAIFGLFGALLFFGLTYKQIFLQTMGLNVLVILGINIAFGFMVQQIDMAAHLGGLLAGILASSILHLPKKKNIIMQLIAGAAYIVLIFSFIMFGMNHNLNSQSYQLMIIEEAISEEEYEMVVDVSGEALDAKGELDGIILFQRSYAYIEMGKIDLAINDLEESISYDPVPEAYFNLALLYYNNDQLEKAEENIRKAYSASPKQEEIIELFEEITGESAGNE